MVKQRVEERERETTSRKSGLTDSCYGETRLSVKSERAADSAVSTAAAGKSILSELQIRASDRFNLFSSLKYKSRLFFKVNVVKK